MKRIVFIITMLCLLGIEVFAQTSNSDVKKSFWTISIVEAHRLGEDSKWSNPGIEINYKRNISGQFNILIRGGYINWGQSDSRVIPLMMGVSKDVIKSNQFSINPYIVLGPSLLIGNDYAGIFATAETGIELAPNNRGLAVFIGFGKNMLFHPDQTNYIKGGIGYQF